MPLSVGEVTAEVAPPAERGTAPARGESQPPAQAELRRQREDLERMHLRAARVAAN
jgi:hypothetical protein